MDPSADPAVTTVLDAVERTVEAAVFDFDYGFAMISRPTCRAGTSGWFDLRVPLVETRAWFDAGEAPGWFGAEAPVPVHRARGIQHGRRYWAALEDGAAPRWDLQPVRGVAAAEPAVLLWLRGVTSATARPGAPGHFDVEADVEVAARRSAPDVAASLREDNQTPPVTVLRGAVVLDGGVVRGIDLTTVREWEGRAMEQRTTLSLRPARRRQVELPDGTVVG
ncbi:hypothetical protein NUM3379_29210 [Kineococcus sp. NUM-3379]